MKQRVKHVKYCMLFECKLTFSAGNSVKQSKTCHMTPSCVSLCVAHLCSTHGIVYAVNTQ